MQCIRVFVAVVRDEGACRFHDHDEVDGAHSRTQGECGVGRHAPCRPTGILVAECQPISRAAFGSERLTVYDVADSFETRATDGPFVGVECVRLLVEPEEEHIAADVEN